MVNSTSRNPIKSRQRYRLLYQLEGNLETPMFLLSILWLYFLIKELLANLSPVEETIVGLIWIVFILEFILKIVLAKDKLLYIKQNWLTAIGLIVPAFRMFRLLRALRTLSASRVVTTTKFIRALSSTKRFVVDLKEVQGTASTAEMNVGIVLVVSPLADIEEMKAFGGKLVEDVTKEMEVSTGLKWFFHPTDPVRLDSEAPKNPTEFLDTASHRMSEGPFDLIVVITDVPLVSRNKRTEAGLASVISRIVVLSTKKFVSITKDQPTRKLSFQVVRWNAAKLLIHLMGHLLGLKHAAPTQSRVMALISFSEKLDRLPSFSESERKNLKKRAALFPERELWGGNVLEGFIFIS